MVSARVLNPVVLSEFCKMSASPSVAQTCGRQLNRIKRDLFGTTKATVTPNEGNKHLSLELERHQEIAVQKWGFDFRAGRPLSTNSPYIWEPVSFQESTYAPEMYTLTRAAHVRPSAAPVATDMEVLLNERAERENFNSSLINSSLESTTDNESCYDSQDELLLGRLNLPRSSSISSSSTVASTSSVILRKRQPKITEFMKERKRLVQATKKISPLKRLRTSSGSSSPSGTISSHFGGLLKRPRHH